MPQEGVPLTPKVPKRDTKTLLMPGHVVGRVQLASKKEISTKEAEALLTGKQELPDGIPRVPDVPPPKAPDPAKSFGNAAKRGKAEAKKALKDAAEPAAEAEQGRGAEDPHAKGYGKVEAPRSPRRLRPGAVNNRHLPGPPRPTS